MVEAVFIMQMIFSQQGSVQQELIIFMQSTIVY